MVDIGVEWNQVKWKGRKFCYVFKLVVDEKVFLDNLQLNLNLEYFIGDFLKYYDGVIRKFEQFVCWWKLEKFFDLVFLLC